MNVSNRRAGVVVGLVLCGAAGFYLWMSGDDIGLRTLGGVELRSGRSAQQEIEWTKAGPSREEPTVTVVVTSKVLSWKLMRQESSAGMMGEQRSMRRGRLRLAGTWASSAFREGAGAYDDIATVWVGEDVGQIEWPVVDRRGLQVCPETIVLHGGGWSAERIHSGTAEVRIRKGMSFRIRDEGIREKRRIRLPSFDDMDSWLVEFEIPSRALVREGASRRAKLWVDSVNDNSNNWADIVVEGLSDSLVSAGPGGQRPGFFFGALPQDEHAEECVMLGISKEAAERELEIVIVGMVGRQRDWFSWRLESSNEECRLVVRCDRRAGFGVYQGRLRVRSRDEREVELPISAVKRAARHK